MRTVALLLLAVGCNRADNQIRDAEADGHRMAIRSVMQFERIEVPTQRVDLEAKTTGNRTKAATIVEHLDRAELLDLSNCPKEFVNNYRAYLAAWRDFADVLSIRKRAAARLQGALK
jgi:hypothetical protein